MKFIEDFTKIEPYFVKVKKVKTNKQNSDPNYKEETETKSPDTEEVVMRGLEEYLNYLRSEKGLIPIEIEVFGNENDKIRAEFDTPRGNEADSLMGYRIRIFNSDDKYIGQAYLRITPFGNVAYKNFYYTSPDKTEEIISIIDINMDENKNLIETQDFTFQKNRKGESEILRVFQIDGKLLGCSFTRLGDKTREYIASSIYDETDYIKRSKNVVPNPCKALEKELYEYTRAMKEYQAYIEEIKIYKGEDVSIERLVQLAILALEEEKKSYNFLVKRIDINSDFPEGFNYIRFAELAEYLSDKKNNLIDGIRGEYIGNIVKLTDEGSKVCIVTKHEKEGKEYKFYTLIDFPEIDMTRGINIAGFYKEEAKDKVVKRMKEVSKIPTFITVKDESGNETVQYYNNKRVSGECPEYEEFVKDFIAPFSEIKPIKDSDFLDRRVQMEH